MWAEMARRTKEDAERTREAVLEAAERIFFERGVARATFEQIAHAAGVTRGAVYWHFRDKLDLFLAIDDRARLPSEQFLTSLAAAGREPLAELAQALSYALADLQADSGRRRILTVVLLRCEFTDDMAAVLYRQQRADDALRVEFRRLLDRAAVQGGLAPPWTSESAALALHALVSGVVFSWLRGTDTSLVKGVEAVRAFLASLAPAVSREVNYTC